MIELLVDFQEALSPLVIPLVLAMSGLLILIVFFYAAGVFVHWWSRKKRDSLKSSWRDLIRKAEIGPDFADSFEALITPFDPRDDFLEVLREEYISPEKRRELYRRAGFYNRDKKVLSARAWWKKVQALHRLKYLSLVGLKDKLTSLLYDPSHEVRITALDSLGHLEEVPELDPVELFESFDAKLDSFLEIKLLELEPSEKFLRPLVDSEKSRLRKAGATLLGQSDKTGHVTILGKLMEDEKTSVRRRAVESLGKIGGYETLPILDRVSRDPRPEVREAAAKSLGEINHEDSLELLDELASDENFRVRLAAFQSLTRFGEDGREKIGNHWSENRRLAREAIFESYQE